MSRPDSRTFDIVVIGSVNVDYVVTGKKLPRPGETVLGDSFAQGFGGKGANQAVGAARLGASVAIVGRIGRDPQGEAARANLVREGVDVAHVTTSDTSATGVALVSVGQNGEKQITVALNANGDLSANDVTTAAAQLGKPACVLAQLEVPDEAVLAAARFAKEVGARFLLDPAPARPLPDELWPLVDLVKPNALEAAALTGIAVTDRASAIRAAEVLLDRGCRAVAIASPEGNHLIAREPARVEIHAKRIAVATVDATGAGDAFMAAVAVVLAEKGSLETALHFANSTAALKTTKPGAQPSLPTRKEVDAFIGGLLRTTFVGVDPTRE